MADYTSLNRMLGNKFQGNVMERTKLVSVSVVLVNFLPHVGFNVLYVCCDEPYPEPHVKVRRNHEGLAVMLPQGSFEILRV